MPIGKIQRRPSFETVSSMDSTMDSRLSSSEVPKMELLKINYVHQAKQALMSRVKVNELQQTQPYSVSSSQKIHHPSPPPLRISNPSKNPTLSKFAAHKKPPNTVTTNSSKNSLSSPVNQRRLQTTPICQALPTIESWQLLNNRCFPSPESKPSRISSTQKLNEKLCFPSDSLPRSAPTIVPSSNSNSSSDSEQCTDSTISPGCERSLSWDYRTKVSTCDIRRDIARAGIKSRADRIARIESTECEHKKSKAVNPSSIKPLNQTPDHQRSRTQKVESDASLLICDVKQIKKIFEEQEKWTMKDIGYMSRCKAPTLTSTPIPVPHERLRTSSASFPPLTDIAVSNCIQCSCDQEKQQQQQQQQPQHKSTELLRNNLGNRLGEVSRKQVSRIPKPTPTNDATATQSKKSSSTITKLHAVDVSHSPTRVKSLLMAGESINIECANSVSNASGINDGDRGFGDEHHLLTGLGRHLRGNKRHHHRTKIERIHIRKKRQPLLIVNQLTNEPPVTTFDLSSATKTTNRVLHERKTCGYKNCKFINCPMSSIENDPNGTAVENASSQEPTKEQQQKLKRLSHDSRNSNSDSGISSEDQPRQLKEININKNIEKCLDCEEIVRKILAKTESSASEKQAYEKLTSVFGDSQSEIGIKLNYESLSTDVNETASVKTSFSTLRQADPNDVQNFAKKNLTKATTDELLTAAINNNSSLNANTNSKQCNIDNDLKNNEKRNRFIKQQNKIRQTTNDAVGGLAATENDKDFKAIYQSANHYTTTDNCVKIFVKGAEVNSQMPPTEVPRLHLLNKRASLVPSSSTSKSFVAHTTTCSAKPATNTATTNSCAPSTSSASSTKSSSSDSAESSSNSSCSATSASSGCGDSTCSFADTTSLCESDRNCCCCHFASESCSVADGIYYNRSLLSLSSACNSSKFSLNSTHNESLRHSALVNCTGSSTPTNGSETGGIFWSSGCFYNESESPEEGDGGSSSGSRCCCSVSCCDDDNSLYLEFNNGDGAQKSMKGLRDNELNHLKASPTQIIQSDDSKKSEVILPRNKQEERRQRQLLQQQQSKWFLQRNSSAEVHLFRNKKLLRKTDAVRDLRPRSMDGVIDSGVSLSGDNGSSPDNGELIQNQQDSEARRLKRGHVLSELLETERIYVSEMNSILKGYCEQMKSEEFIHLVPASLRGKEDILFGNLDELYTFHNEVFLKDLENCISTTELVALCFVQRRDTFYRLYSFYCQNIPRSERLRETLVDTHLFLQECQKHLGHKLPLAAYLLKPVQRITKYQLLLKDLLRFSDSGSCTKELQKALDCMLIVLKCVNDSMHQVAITGFPSDLSQQGDLLLQDSFQIWSESKKDIRLRIKPQQRHIFLYQKSMLFCKQTSKTGQNRSTYQFKHYLKMSQIGLTESVRGDIKRFEVWMQGRQEVHTLQAPTIETKNKWVAEIKRVLLNQLEELKGEKIKQYGLTHRGLRQTTSWDTPNILMGGGIPQRKNSCDGSSQSSNRNSNCSSNGDDNISPLLTRADSNVTPAASAISVMSSSGGGDISEKDIVADCGWNSDYSNSEDEMSIIEDNSTPGSRFIALADYVAMGHSEVSMREGDSVELLKVGCAGWWFVRVIEAKAEGWTPAAYLESFNRKSRSSSRNQERINFSKAPE